MTQRDSLRIGKLADAAGVSVETVRFYERRSLVPAPPRTPSGYRQFPPETVERIRFIRRAQVLGFTLAEIRELLELRAQDAGACGSVATEARAKLEDVQMKIDELERIKRALNKLVASCEAREPTGDCPILSEFEGDLPGSS